jgi:hypothetical protein
MNVWEIKWKLVGVFGKLIIDFLFNTAKIETQDYEQAKSVIESRKFIAAIWHSRILMFSYWYRGWNGAILVSRSGDGEIIARILQKFGHETVRGSTTRGGLRGLAALIRKLENKTRSAVIIPDGPQGPRFKVQPGIVALAAKTGHPIVPMTYSARKIKIFNSWDRFILPFPFTFCKIAYGTPIHVPKIKDKADLVIWRKKLEDELNRITRKADRSFGHVIE